MLVAGMQDFSGNFEKMFSPQIYPMWELILQNE